MIQISQCLSATEVYALCGLIAEKVMHVPMAMARVQNLEATEMPARSFQPCLWALTLANLRC